MAVKRHLLANIGGRILQKALLLLLLLPGHYQEPLGITIGRNCVFCFTRSFYNTTIYENSAARTYVSSEVRMGINLTGGFWPVTYDIVSGNEEGLFAAENYTLGDFCFLRIHTNTRSSAVLNREVQDVYELRVTASVAGDLEASTLVSLRVLDTNDLRPLFAPTTYSVTLAESTPLETSVTQVTATDADEGPNGELYYYFREKNDLFAIHPTSGVVTVSARLDANQQKSLEMDILAVDRGMKLYSDESHSSTAKLFVHIERVNEFVPTLSVVNHIPSWKDKDPIFAVVTVEDQDEGQNGDIEWVSIVAGDPLELFAMERSVIADEYYIKLTDPADWDKLPYSSNITLQAKDRGSPPKFSESHLVWLLVGGPPPLQKKFEKDSYEITISEISPPGSFVEIVRVNSNSRSVRYMLSSTSFSPFFNINAVTGVLTTAQFLTTISQDVVLLVVVEIDSSLKANVLIFVEDFNDNSPVFTQPFYVGTVSEGSPTGTEVLTVMALDDDKEDNARITYIIASLQPLPFTLDHSSGVLKTSEDLDFESSPEMYSFVIRASDWGSPYRRESEVNVTVRLLNVNDNQPMFEKVSCHAVVSRDYPVGHPILTVSAIDIDEPESISYKIRSGNNQDFFSLNPDSGVLSLRRSFVPASQRSRTFSLEVVASDGETLSESMLVNISVVKGQTPSKSLNCKESKISQKLVEKLLLKNRVESGPQMVDILSDLFSINRLSPKFEALPNSILISEDLALGASVYQVKASDGDSGLNGKILYAITTGEVINTFNIDMESGLITVLLPMDREEVNGYILNITIYDLGQPQKATWQLLTVNLKDANDNAPVFAHDSYSSVIRENAIIGTEVIQIQAADKDLGQNGQVYYSLLTSQSQFKMDSVTGVISVAGQLDMEATPVINLKIEARDGAQSGNRKFSVSTLKIFLEDVNDCPPTFVPKGYNARVLEDLPLGTVIAWLDAQDPDMGVGGQVRYSLADDYDGKFEVHRESGTVRLSGELDYEKQLFYNLTVVAEDCGQPVSLRAISFVAVEVINVNENLFAPHFTDFALKAVVKENSRIGTSVLQVVAHDDDSGRDGAIHFSIKGGSGLDHFSIDEATGIIYTTESLDSEVEGSYWLTVYATDHGVVPLHSSVEVYIEVEDVNDNAPLTTKPIYHPAVPENSPKDTHVLQINAQDLDASSSPQHLTYRISSGNPQNFFSIHPKTGLITTSTRKLDREQQDEHFLEVTVSDGGAPPRHTSVWVIVHILDENDNEPRFSQELYQINLLERDRKNRGDPIYRALAHDRDLGANANLSYSIVAGNEDGKFSIHPQTAVLSCRKLVSAGTSDVLTIRSTDGGNPPMSSTSQLYIEWIPKALNPSVSLLFTQLCYNFSTQENTPVGEVVGVVSIKHRVTPLWFAITGASAAREMFHILQTTCCSNCSTEGGRDGRCFDSEDVMGTIVVGRPLDAEFHNFYNLTVTVTDGTSLASTKVFITVADTNDNTPGFSHSLYEVVVSEDTPADTELLQVQAFDLDKKSKLSFSIQNSLDPGSIRLFRIGPGTGSLYTADRLDYESQTQHILTVMVKDHELPYHRDLARIQVLVQDANDHAPYFSRTVYDGSVYESASIGTSVLQITALDRDKGQNGELLYSIEAGNTGNTFSVDRLTGIVAVVKQLDLGQYVLTVRVTDCGFPPMGAVATVRVAVILSHYSIPKFLQKEYQAEVRENMPSGTFVTAVSSVSRSAITYKIKQDVLQAFFKINAFTGIITTRKPLDYETAVSYTLTIHACSMAGLVSYTTVNVQVLDENDNPPVFQQWHYAGGISEAAAINSVVHSAQDGSPLVLRATDMDKNHNGRLLYHIVEDIAQTCFAVDSGSGSIRTIANLDYEACSVFNFSVGVRDSGRPQLTAERVAYVTVWVTNVNDSPPKFSHDTYESVLLLPTCLGAEVVQLSASDPDGGGSAGLSFTLADSSLEHFAVGADTGIITVKRKHFSRDRYRFSVEVSDGKFSSTAIVNVVVREAMDGGLAFPPQQSSSSVVENCVNVTFVAVVTAVGSSRNEPLRYSLLNAGSRFHIKPTSGVIVTTGVEFDREQQEIYELVVQAAREQDQLRVVRTTVTVLVDDVNDNPPTFINLPYYAAVDVEAEAGSAIFYVTATDKDKGVNGQVSYYLKEEHSLFRVDKLTGELRLKRALERDLSNAEYGVVVFARDGGNPSLLTAVEFPITVVNKAMPVFEKRFYSVSVSEDVAVHTPVLGINAASPAGEKVVYIIVDGDPLSQFSVGFDTGVISVIYPLDFESSPYYRLTVMATDSLSGAHAEVDVEVAVADMNDNPPVFEKTSYRASISETSVIGTSVLSVTATDKDSEKNNKVHYEILSQNRDCFQIDSSSGLVFAARMLDYELVQQHELIVKAVDNGFPHLSTEVLVTVNIEDTNDNFPVFSQQLYEALVSVIAAKHQFVTCVQAFDQDRSDSEQLRYSILSGNERSNFAIDQMTGIITLASQGRQGMYSAYILNVSVSDGIFTNMAQVNIQVLEANLYSPVFSQRFYLAQVHENAPTGSEVILLRATDEDSGVYSRISYSFVCDLGNKLFSIDTSGHIFTRRTLDREDPANKDILLTVMALDGGGRASFCSVRVLLLDQNDNTPQFKSKEYRVSVRSSVSKGIPVTQIQSYDSDDGLNGKVSYSLYSEARVPLVDILEIDPENGWIMTKGSFSHLRGTVLSFFAKATDGGVPERHSLVPVYIHVLPPEASIPLFTQPQYSFTVPEDTPVGTTLGSVHLAPSLPAVFSLISGETSDSNQASVFLVEQETGIIRLMKALDHELAQGFYFKVSATTKQAGLESVSVVDMEVKVLDVNDNAPSFETGSYEATVMEGMPTGTRVIQVRALDPDWGFNGQVTYRLVQSSDIGTEQTESSFAIDRNTGWITTLTVLDFEDNSLHLLTVVAADLGESICQTSTAVVMVSVSDINDNPPRFEKDHYRGAVLEGESLGKVVAILTSLDKDSADMNGRVTIHITGGNSRGAFVLGLDQGQWILHVRHPLDREEQDLYHISVTATDGLYTAQTMVEVTVLDNNDNSPKCEQASYARGIPEGTPLERVVMTVKATDADLGANSEIEYSVFGIGVEDFYMNANTGELKTASVIDRERSPVYKLVAQATDGGGFFCRSKILLTVLDVNDNPPAFPTQRYTASVYENAAPKTMLTRLQAYDPDEGANRRVLYSLVDSSGGIFSINESTGIVFLEKTLDRELQSYYSITVQAADEGLSDILISQADLDITVLDVNDNPPVFGQGDYRVTVREDVPLGSEVLRVYATSSDVGANAEVYYTVRSGNKLEHFQIALMTGVISVSSPLDYEMCTDYFLSVEAWDGGIPPLSAVTSVTISVTDVNDHPPKFSKDLYKAMVKEDAAPGQPVIKLKAVDLDSGMNGRITYVIVSGDEGNQFSTETTTGLIKVNQSLDREMVSFYSLIVWAVDSGSPTLSSAATVNITVSDVNDNPPKISPSNSTVVIPSTKPLGSSILQLSVTDADAAGNGAPYEFLLLSGNEGDAFALDQKGVLRTNQFFGQHVGKHYSVELQVRDSGKPSLSSTSLLSVHVSGESLYKPEAFPLDIYLVIAGEEFQGGPIGRIHATDRDKDHTLSFSHKFQKKTLFKVNRKDGRVVALAGVRPGRYLLNATVSDGHFSVWVEVRVEVVRASRPALRAAVALRVHGVGAEDFVQLHLGHIRSVVPTLVGVAPTWDACRVLGVQAVPGMEDMLDVLLAVQTDGGTFCQPEHIAQGIESWRQQLEGSLRIVSVREQGCAPRMCGETLCLQSVLLEPRRLVSYSTATNSFISPPFSCSCTAPQGDPCAPLTESCQTAPCPADMTCVPSSATGRAFSCQCVPARLGGCAGESALSFAGNSYVTYRLSDKFHPVGLKLRLQLRTLHSQGVIMQTRSNPCTLLRIDSGHLWVHWDCADGTAGLGISGRSVSDGRWHSVTLELSRNHTLLTLDDSYTERRRRRPPARLGPLAVDRSISFGAQVRAEGAAELEGFSGCMSSLEVNGKELPLQTEPGPGVAVSVVEVNELALGCVLISDACYTHTCRNGGRCTGLPSGGFQCLCPVGFSGLLCEREFQPCSSSPCLNGGLCRPVEETFVCNCPAGFSGPTCSEDVDECETVVCKNAGVCDNTFGTFSCNCTAGFEGRWCEMPLPYVGWEEVTGIAALLFITFFLLALLLACRKLRPQGGASPPPSRPIPLNQPRWPPSQQDGDTCGPCGLHAGPDAPPRVLVRPTAHSLPWMQSHSPVCSVAPNRSVSPAHRTHLQPLGAGLSTVWDGEPAYSQRHADVQSVSGPLAEQRPSVVTVIRLPDGGMHTLESDAYPWLPACLLLSHTEDRDEDAPSHYDTLPAARPVTMETTCQSQEDPSQ